MTIRENSITFIAEGAQIRGALQLEGLARVHGTVEGELFGQAGSTIILAKSSRVAGDIFADILLVDGFVQGNISATQKITISGTGRVQGNITAPKIEIEFGAWFEGISRTEKPVK